MVTLQKLPVLAIDDSFESRSLEPDGNGIYRTVEYYRENGTLFMRSRLSERIRTGEYKYVTCSFYSDSGLVHLHDITWELAFDQNKRTIGIKKVRDVE